MAYKVKYTNKKLGNVFRSYQTKKEAENHASRSRGLYISMKKQEPEYFKERYGKGGVKIQVIKEK